LLSAADKKTSSTKSLFAFGSAGGKYEEAAELYAQAGNAFRLQKLLVESGQAFEKAADCQLRCDEKDDAANTLVEAYKVYRRDRPEDAARVLLKAIGLFSQKGNIRRAANYQFNMGELYEVDLNEPGKAIDAYDTAAEWYSSDQAEATANKAYLKVADLAALAEQYDRAIQNFEHVASKSLLNNLTRYSTKDYFFKAGICRLATGDHIATRNSIDRYCEQDPSFTTTRECQLLQNLLAAIEAGDAQTFTDKLFEFDQMMKLDKWKTTLLLRIKNSINEEPDLT